MAETAKQWINRVFASVIKNGAIVMAEGVIKAGNKERKTGAKIVVYTDTFEEMFKDEIEAGGSDRDIANAIASKTTTLKMRNPEGNDEETTVELGYRKFIENMAAKGLF